MASPRESPQTPRRTINNQLKNGPDANHTAAKTSKVIDDMIFTLSTEWDLDLTPPDPSLPRSSAPVISELEDKVIFYIRYLTHKHLITTVYEIFEFEAQTLYNGWVKFPSDLRLRLPQYTPRRPRRITPSEREELMECFVRISMKESQGLKEEDRSRGTRGLRTSLRGVVPSLIDDSPIPFKVGASLSERRKIARGAAGTESHTREVTLPNPPTPEMKRAGTFFLDQSPSKKTKRPTKSIISGTTAVSRNASTMRPPQLTSFTSHTSGNSTDSFLYSRRSSVFDHMDEPFMNLTQDTTLTEDEPLPVHDQVFRSHVLDFDKSNYRENASPISDYGSSINPEDIEGSPSARYIDSDPGEEFELSQGMQSASLFSSAEDSLSLEDKLRSRLEGIFPGNPPQDFFRAPLYFRFEIMRVFLHTGTPLSMFQHPSRQFDYNQYERLWAHLRKIVGDKPMPPRSSKEVWAATEELRSSRGIVMSGFLSKVDPKIADGPLFKLRLQPLKLDQTHRLQRRFGSDRFFELDIPNITGKNAPEAIQKLGENGKTIVVEWLTGNHKLLGRTWNAFCNKPQRVKAKKKKSAIPTHFSTVESKDTASQRIFFFAVDGRGFGNKNGKTPEVSQTVESRSQWSVDGLLNWLRPTKQNQHQSYLKLYARTVLGLSRNIPTVVVERYQNERLQIIYKNDIEVVHEDAGHLKREVMTDGAGRISQSLARKIIESLKLDHMPSGFQGRFGNAKGFWSIDPQDTGIHDWIEIYDGQRKWVRNEGIGAMTDDPDFDDPAHRTFEVNGMSGDLRSAELNAQFLPILVDRAIDKPEMIRAIEKILQDGLTEAIMAQRAAMENPLTCRQWVRDTNPRIGDKIKLGVIPFTAGLPTLQGDIMNLLLDAGFDPMTLPFFRKRAEALYNQKCDAIRDEMKITITRSTYAYMVPDFSGVLEPNEVYIHMTNDLEPGGSVSLQSGLPFHNIDLLVARSPAHFTSDIQKVKAVDKVELRKLKNVIVFSTKGVPSLAAKLSGGDYDGDIAWICWEPSIVRNFENAEVPQTPDLVKEGFITKDPTKYQDLVLGEDKPTSIFLQHAFKFNLEPSMLGICTRFKEDWSYSQKDLGSDMCVCMNQLLSDLVDQAKQGYIFDDERWARFKKLRLGGPKFIRPSYRNNELKPSSDHILDRITYVVDVTVKRVLTEFNANLPLTVSRDEHVAGLSRWAHNEAVLNPEWKHILHAMKVDINAIKEVWTKTLARDKPNEEEISETFSIARDRCFEMFCSLRPVGDTVLTRTLLESWNPHPELSRWMLLCASVLFTSYPTSSLIWWVAGRQLCHLKATQLGMVQITHQMYAMQKPDASYVRRRLLEVEGKEEESVFDEEEESLMCFDDDDDGMVVIED